MRVARLLAAALLAAAPVLAAAIDGTWTIPQKTKDGTTELVLKLSAQGSTLTGTLGRKSGRRGAAIEDGKLDSDKFSFAVARRAKDGPKKILYRGTVAGDELKGEFGPEGGRMRPFVASASSAAQA